MLVILLCGVILFTKSLAQLPDNPCSSIFQYRYNNSVIYGEIIIPYDGSKEMYLTVNVSTVGLHKNAKIDIKLQTPDDNILSASNLKYSLNFPNETNLPKITEIRYNNKIYCTGPEEPISSDGVTNLWASNYIKISQYTYNPQIKMNDSLFSQNENNKFTTEKVFLPKPQAIQGETSCGISNDQSIQHLIVSGQKTTDHEFPWLVALFWRIHNTYSYTCTASLISKRHVITAAHCVFYYKIPRIQKEDILLVLGISNISHWATASGALRLTAHNVIPHPNYKEGTGHGDIAIIALSEEIEFTRSIRPICLWSYENEIKNMIGVDGEVAGWGKASPTSSSTESELRKIKLPIVSQDNCILSHKDLVNLTSNITFCAGHQNGSGPCRGDSGSPFMIKDNNRWILRGIVSTSVKDEYHSCDLNQYVVFADTAKLNKWILSEIN